MIRSTEILIGKSVQPAQCGISPPANLPNVSKSVLLLPPATIHHSIAEFNFVCPRLLYPKS